MEYTTLFFLVLAVLVILKLRGVLGRRTGTEQPPFDTVRRDTPANDKVVPLPQRGPRPPASAEAAEAVEDATRARPGGLTGPLGQALQAVMRADRSFDPEHFLSGAKVAYEMIVTAFAQGDRKSLKPLLSKDVFDGFDQAIAARERAGHTVESSFVGLDTAAITEAQLRGSTAQITVRFVSKLIQATRDASGAVVDGDPTRVTDVTDVWTFARDVTARDPNWRLVATEAAA